ncbi:MAG: cupin domain-containing protein [Bacteroidetes bacterium]|jgi:quercetin dioxygenase-like cupin family protein|nr:cupin domain-containing protein [Bacteroidota bacterium]
MLTKRDLVVSLITASLTLGMAWTAGALDPIMGTTIFHWQDLEVEATEGAEARRYFEAATATLLRLELRAVTLEPGTSPHPPRPHQQSAEQLIVVKDGTLKVEVGDVAENTAGGVDEKVQRLTSGAAFFLGPNQWHALSNPESEPVTYYVIDWLSPGMMGSR